jgi:tRNA A-37 threonylcarbamoyl transferase component Bud32
MMPLAPAGMLAIGAALIAIVVYLVLILPRLSARAGWVISVLASCACLLVGGLAGALVWFAVPVIALLIGHLGWTLGGSSRAAARVTATGRAAGATASRVASGSPGISAAAARSATTQPGAAGANAAAPAERHLPATLGRYRIEALLGRGAMGSVYLGHDPKIGRQVAIKTMALSREFEGAELAEARERFFREAETAGRLQHRDIVTIFDAGEAADLAFIAMEYLRGQDLQPYTQSGRLLPVGTVLAIVERVALALAYAHSQGVVHRDIKPANVMIDLATDTVKVTDFGIARIADSSRTRTGMVLGTPSFMSPEQMAGQRVDGRSDLYSLGVMLFQLLTGRLPHQADSMAKLMYQIANEPAPDLRDLRPELPEALANVVALSLEKRPEVRYADGQQMATDLRAVAAALPPELAGNALAAAPEDASPDAYAQTVKFSRTDPGHNS